MSLYAGSASQLTMNSVDSVAWANISNLFSMDVSTVDRSGIVQVPCDIKIYEPFRLPALPDSMKSLTYEECCYDSAKNILTIQDRLQKPIYLLYSGGIDSTLALISLLKADSHLHEKVTIVLSNDSIYENPKFYKSYVRQFKMVSSADVDSLLDGNKIVVGGEFNDQLFGTDIIKFSNVESKFDSIFDPWTRDNVTKLMLAQKMYPDSAHRWFEVVREQIKQLPIEIKTVFEFFWWINFCFKWQPVFFRVLARSRYPLSHELVADHFHHFYSTPNFQIWSMLNPQLKIGNSIATYKQLSKDLIFEFNGDEDYRKFKLKEQSLNYIFRQVPVANAITSNMSLVDWVPPEEYYVEINDFMQP